LQEGKNVKTTHHITGTKNVRNKEAQW
jgi:hypothetical protein